MPVPRTCPLQDWFIPAVLAGEVIVDIGQIAPDTVRQLDKLVRTGELLKWRGKWHRCMDCGRASSSGRVDLEVA